MYSVDIAFSNLILAFVHFASTFARINQLASESTQCSLTRDTMSGKRKFTDSAPEETVPKVVKTEEAGDVKASEGVKSEPELDVNAKLEAAGEFPFIPANIPNSLTLPSSSRSCGEDCCSVLQSRAPAFPRGRRALPRKDRNQRHQESLRSHQGTDSDEGT